MRQPDSLPVTSPSENLGRQSPVVILRVPRPMLDKIDAFGCGEYLRRSEKIRRLLSVGLDAEVRGG